MNRRDLLKLFGAGATIVPVVGGMSQELTRAIIIEPPKVEMAPAPKLIEATAADINGLQRNEIVEVVVFIRQKNPHRVWRMDCKGFVSSYTRSLHEVNTFENHGLAALRMPGFTESKLEIILADTPKLMEGR